jgi:hypothetical protein
VAIVASGSQRARWRKERGERMFYGDYQQELAKERMRAAIEEREHANLAKQARLAGRDPRGGMFARSAAFVTALFR